MKPREYTITLTVRSNAPIAVLRDRSQLSLLVDATLMCGYSRLANILTVTVQECEPWDLPPQLELGGGA